MKIVNAEIIPANMGRKDTAWRHALTEPGGEARDVGGLIVKLTTDDGLMGLGYTNIAHHGLTEGAILAALKVYTELVVGQDPFNIEKIMGMLNQMLRGNNEAKAAIEFALHDLQAKALGVPLYVLLGGLVRKEIPIIRIVGIKEPAQMAANAVKLVEQGYSHIKIKIDSDPEKNLKRVKEIRKAVGDTIHLTLDANQSYSPKTAIGTLKRMCEYGVELCEQPVRGDDWEGLAAVTRAVDGMLIEAHESALTLENIFGLAKGKVADCINIKIVHLGGLRNAKIAAEICRLGNIPCRVGTVGSRLYSAVSMHFVASTQNISYACELGEFERLSNDPAEGLEIKNGVLEVPSIPGIGVSLRI